MEREFEDVAAVVDAVAEASGSKVDLFGHSSGGFCAFKAALLTRNVRRLVLYEGWPVPAPEVMGFPPGVGERIDALVGKGDGEAAVETFARELVRVPGGRSARARCVGRGRRASTGVGPRLAAGPHHLRQAALRKATDQATAS